MSERKIRLAPHMVQTVSVRSMMLDVIVALLPAFGMSVFLFGWWVLVLAALSVGTCVLSEYLYRKLTRQSNSLGDLSACVTGLLLCMTLPSDSPWWVPVLGGVFAIVVVKQFYGGLGRNFMNPALAGRMLVASFPMLMTTWVDPGLRLSVQELDAVTGATPMSYLHGGDLPPLDAVELLTGQHGGSLGEVSAVMLLLGGLYLMGRRVISMRIPLGYLGTVALLTFLFPMGGCDRVDWMLAQLLSGGLIFGALFMATDPTTTPVTPAGHVMFGVGCGVLTVVLRYFGSYPEGVGWAILTMNSCAWLLDKAGLPRRYGEKPFRVVLRWLAGVREQMAQVHFVKPDLSDWKPRDGRVFGEAQLDRLRQWGRNVLCLGGTVVCVGAMVFAVQRATELRSVQGEARRQQEMLEQVMPQAVTCSEAPLRANGALTILHAFGADNALLGHCVEVQTHGFNGHMTLMVGVDNDGKVTGVAITDHDETVSVAEKALSEQNLDRYVGRFGTIRHFGYNSVSTVSGATATSDAITDGVNRALAIVAVLGEEHQVEFVDSETE